MHVFRRIIPVTLFALGLCGCEPTKPMAVIPSDEQELCNLLDSYWRVNYRAKDKLETEKNGLVIDALRREIAVAENERDEKVMTFFKNKDFRFSGWVFTLDKVSTSEMEIFNDNKLYVEVNLGLCHFKTYPYATVLTYIGTESFEFLKATKIGDQVAADGEIVNRHVFENGNSPIQAFLDILGGQKTPTKITTRNLHSDVSDGAVRPTYSAKVYIDTSGQILKSLIPVKQDGSKQASGPSPTYAPQRY